MLSDQTKTTADHGFQACVPHFMHVHFVSALTPEMGRLVESKFSSLKTKEELIKVAVEAEVASGQEARHIASIEAELAALKISSSQYTSGQGGRRGSTRGRGGRGGAC